MDEVEVVVAHSERATLRVGDVFLKVDADQARIDVEVEAMSLAPVPTPEVLWRKPPVLAIAALPGTTLGRLGRPSTGTPAAWAAAGAVIRTLHDAPLPPRSGRAGQSIVALAAELDAECESLVTNGLLPADLVTRNRQVAEAALRPWTPAFTHGDLQIAPAGGGAVKGDERVVDVVADTAIRHSSRSTFRTRPSRPGLRSGTMSRSGPRVVRAVGGPLFEDRGSWSWAGSGGVGRPSRRMLNGGCGAARCSSRCRSCCSSC